MSKYAVINPATGETVKTYDTITDAGLTAAIIAADETHRTWSRTSTGRVHRLRSPARRITSRSALRGRRPCRACPGSGWRWSRAGWRC